MVTRLLRAWCRAVCAYVEDMTAGRANHPALSAALERARADFAPIIDVTQVPEPTATAAQPATTEYGGRERGDQGIAKAYARPLWTLLRLLPEEFAGEWAERTEWRARAGLTDFIVCGGVLDDPRVRRYMHASHAKLINGRPARAAGNRVFPNGFIECELAVPRDRGFRVVVRGDATASRGLKITIDGRTMHAVFDAHGEIVLPVERTGRDTILVRLEKSGADYPWVFGVGTIL